MRLSLRPRLLYFFIWPQSHPSAASALPLTSLCHLCSFYPPSLIHFFQQAHRSQLIKDRTETGNRALTWHVAQKKTQADGARQRDEEPLRSWCAPVGCTLHLRGVAGRGRGVLMTKDKITGSSILSGRKAVEEMDIIFRCYQM